MSYEKNKESITLDEWISNHHTEEEIRSVFLNMDRALKYIHEKGYCIEVFYPTEISVLNNDDDYIYFNKIMKLPEDEATRKMYIVEDIFNSTFIQVGIYSNSLKYLTPSFLRENFDDFSQFLPAKDVPYYRGIVQRNADVYFGEYALEIRNRDLQDLDRQLGEEGKVSPNTYKKEIDLTNQSINDVIYKQISGNGDGAYIHLFLIPILVLSIMMVFTLTFWFMGFFVK